MRSTPVSFLAAFAVVAACSSTTTTTGTPAPAATDTADAAVNEEAGANDAGATSAPLAYETYVILGDSISDRGGSGPFFYDLLDAALKKKFVGIQPVKNSEAGSVSADLQAQPLSGPYGRRAAHPGLPFFREEGMGGEIVAILHEPAHAERAHSC